MIKRKYPVTVKQERPATPLQVRIATHQEPRADPDLKLHAFTTRPDVGKSESGRGRNDEVYVRDKFGFQHQHALDRLKLYEAFKLHDINFKKHPAPETIFMLTALQNSHLWLFTKDKKYLFKATLLEDGRVAKPTPEEAQTSVVDDPIYLRGSLIKDLIVDETGEHGFFIGEHCVFYNYFLSEQVFALEVAINAKITALRVLRIGEDSKNAFHLLAGTDKGQIFHAFATYNASQHFLVVIDKFVQCIRLGSAIHDLEVFLKDEITVVLAATESALYQFNGDDIRRVLQTFGENVELAMQRCILIKDNRKQKFNQTKYKIANGQLVIDQTFDQVLHEEEDETTIYEKGDKGPDTLLRKLQLFYCDDGESKRPRRVAGFGWRYSKFFVCGEYPEDDNRAVLTRDDLQYIEYVKKDFKPVRAEQEVPIAFALSLFHIAFVYPSNFTVISRRVLKNLKDQDDHFAKPKNEVKPVFFKNFDASKQLKGCCLDQRKHRLLVSTVGEQLLFASLKNEDVEAWKQFHK